jgi:hypothetical protein
LAGERLILAGVGKFVLLVGLVAAATGQPGDKTDSN